MPILVTLVAAYAVGFLLDKLRVPGGMMIGAVIGSCALGVATGFAEMPRVAKIAAQIIAGAYIGAGVSREEVREMKTVVKPALILLPGLLIINVVAGLIISAVSPLDLITAFMSCAPGGVSDIPMIAADLGADTSKVVILQFVRFLMGIALFPFLIKLISRRDREGQEAEIIRREKTRFEWLPAVLTLLVATAAGLLGMISPMPSGTMPFAVFGVIALKMVYPKAQTPTPLRKVAQLLSGAFVGAGISMKQLAEIPYLIVPIFVLLACYLLGALLISTLLVRAKCFGRTEAMLASTPAGASDMALISADLGIRNVKLILLQVMRVIVVISLFPTILNFIASLLGGL